ncbi:hypothetical protein Q3A86_31340 [Streptomyces sp. NBUA17]|uniref:hypothetical protein n=1 Tax=Streptomyces sp. NBUA17 TaxID=3062275 RepID=UPI0037DA70FE
MDGTGQRIGQHGPPINQNSRLRDQIGPGTRGRSHQPLPHLRIHGHTTGFDETRSRCSRAQQGRGCKEEAVSTAALAPYSGVRGGCSLWVK